MSIKVKVGELKTQQEVRDFLKSLDAEQQSALSAEQLNTVLSATKKLFAQHFLNIGRKGILASLAMVEYLPLATKQVLLSEVKKYIFLQVKAQQNLNPLDIVKAYIRKFTEIKALAKYAETVTGDEFDCVSDIANKLTRALEGVQLQLADLHSNKKYASLIDKYLQFDEIGLTVINVKSYKVGE